VTGFSLKVNSCQLIQHVGFQIKGKISE